MPWWEPKEFFSVDRADALFYWMRENATMDNSIIALEESLRNGDLNDEALEELKASDQGKLTYWDSYCAAYPSEPECLIYDC
jgi:hypothetical protein